MEVADVDDDGPSIAANQGGGAGGDGRKRPLRGVAATLIDTVIHNTAAGIPEYKDVVGGIGPRRQMSCADPGIACGIDLRLA